MKHQLSIKHRTQDDNIYNVPNEMSVIIKQNTRR